MIKRFSIHLIVQFAVFIFVGVMAFCPATILIGGIGGTAIWIAPEFIFGIVDEIVCPEGTLEYYWSYQEPNTYDAHIECVCNEGVREDVLFTAILGVLGVAFLVAFCGFLLPIFILLAIVTFIVTRKVISGRERGRNGS